MKFIHDIDKNINDRKILDVRKSFSFHKKINSIDQLKKDIIGTLHDDEEDLKIKVENCLNEENQKKFWQRNSLEHKIPKNASKHSRLSIMSIPKDILNAKSNNSFRSIYDKI